MKRGGEANSKLMVKNKHEWQWTGSAWRCTDCLRQTKVKLDTECGEVPPSLKAALGKIHQDGHLIYHARTTAGHSCMWCNRCYGWGENRARKLASLCAGKYNRGGATVKKAVDSGKHPRSGEDLHDIYPIVMAAQSQAEGNGA